MNRLIKYSFAFITLVLAYGCRQRLNERLTLWRNDKIPYGTYYAYENLRYIFPNADIENSNNSPQTFATDETSSAYIIIGSRVVPSNNEIRAILDHVYTGNKVFISAWRIDGRLLDSFRLKSSNAWALDESDSLKLNLYDPESYDSLYFTYPGRKINNYFTEMDTVVTNILGKDELGRANFVKINYESGGSAIIHLNPLAFTNFFLLHKQNKAYYDFAMSTIPDSVSVIRWDDYYRRHINGENESEKSAFSKLGEILKNEVLRWAFWLTLLLFAIIYIFESKRKQRAIPSVKPLNNTSLDFVKTIGRLYYQRRDNKNLASKMTAHFLGHIRSRYNISTSKLDENFEKGLSLRSGVHLEDIKIIIGQAKAIEEKGALSDDELISFNNKLEKFYKQT